MKSRERVRKSKTYEVAWWSDPHCVGLEIIVERMGEKSLKVTS